MFENSHQLQLALLSALITVMTIVCFVYIIWQQPDALRMNKNGVPFFSADVVHPDTGEAIPINTLIEHYRADN